MPTSAMSSSNSKSISELLQRKDMEALEQLLTWYRPFLIDIAKGMLGRNLRRKIDTSDLVQETLKDVVKGFSKINAKTCEEWNGYLYRVLARNVSDTKKLFLGNRKRDIRRESTAQSTHNFSDQLEDIRSQEPIEQIIDREFAEQVLLVLQRFPKELQRILRWRYRKQLTYQEIGDRVGRSKDDARMLIQRCLEEIRNELYSYD
ncbi:MAG: sigma-70 family RNA polymerase sigma factor [Pirellula sp.]